MSTNKKYTILYVDDEKSNLRIFKNTFRREYNIFIAESALEGLQILQNNHIDLILTDQRMPEMDGVEFLKETIKSHPDLNRILVTGFTDFEALRIAINEAQIFQYIQKPWTESQLRRVIDHALDIHTLKIENKVLNNAIHEKNEMLQKANVELLELDALKSELLAIISHEIRTPLNGMMGPLELIKSEITEQSEMLNELFGLLETSVNRLEKFAVTAERITSLKAHKYNIRYEKLNLHEVFKTIYELLKIKFDEKNIKFVFEAINDFSLYCDHELFYLTIKELVENALKFTKQDGKIYIKAKTEDGFNNIEIADQGIGFNENVLKNIFKLFVTGSKNIDQSMGIDLALIKLIIEAHKGSVSAKNNEFGGASIIIKFPENLKNNEQ